MIEMLVVVFFLNLEKIFETAEHEILLSKLAHCSVRGLANDWFKSYLSNIKQYVSIIGYNSNLANLKIGVSQGLILGPLFFLIYINDLKQARMSNSVMSITLRMTQT